MVQQLEIPTPTADNGISNESTNAGIDTNGSASIALVPTPTPVVEATTDTPPPEIKERKKAGRPSKQGQGEGSPSQKPPRNPYKNGLKPDLIDDPKTLEFAGGIDSTDYVLDWIYENLIAPLGLENDLEMIELLVAQSFTRGLGKRHTKSVQKFKLLQQARQLKAVAQADPSRAAEALSEVQRRLGELASAKPIEQAS